RRIHHREPDDGDALPGCHKELPQRRLAERVAGDERVAVRRRVVDAEVVDPVLPGMLPGHERGPRRGRDGRHDRAKHGSRPAGGGGPGAAAPAPAATSRSSTSTVPPSIPTRTTGWLPPPPTAGAPGGAPRPPGRRPQGGAATARSDSSGARAAPGPDARRRR